MSEETQKEAKPNGAPPAELVKPKSLITKLCEVGASLTYIQKRGNNTFHVYKYATEADIVSAIRLELYTRHVFLIPDVIETKREIIERKTVKEGKEKITQTALTDMNIKWTWLDGDTGEILVSHMPGCGEDSGDKGTYKAITGSEKYLLLKTFLIPTFDDAEKLTPEQKKEFQQRLAKDKTAELKAKIEANKAETPEEAQKELAKGRIVHVSLPDRFKGEYFAVYGFTLGMEQFMSDCAANRFRGPEGIFYKLSVQYLPDLDALIKRLGYTLEKETEE